MEGLGLAHASAPWIAQPSWYAATYASWYLKFPEEIIHFAVLIEFPDRSWTCVATFEQLMGTAEEYSSMPRMARRPGKEASRACYAPVVPAVPHFGGELEWGRCFEDPPACLCGCGSKHGSVALSHVTRYPPDASLALPETNLYSLLLHHPVYVGNRPC